MAKPKLPAIPTTFLPNGWAQTVANQFEVSKGRIEQIVYGLGAKTSSNEKIWDHIVELAEQGKKLEELKTQSQLKRVEALS